MIDEALHPDRPVPAANYAQPAGRPVWKMARLTTDVGRAVAVPPLRAAAQTADRVLRILGVAPRGQMLLTATARGLLETQRFGCRVLIGAWPAVAQELLRAGA